MIISSIFSAAARNGVTFKEERNWHGMIYYTLTKGDRKLEFHTNGQDSEHVCTIVRRDPQTDASVDLFMDTYYDTIKGAMHYLNPTGERVTPVRSAAAPITVDVQDVTVSKNEEKNGIEIRFPSKPDASVIQALKDHGFRWSQFAKTWWKRYSDADMAWAMETFAKQEKQDLQPA